MGAHHLHGAQYKLSLQYWRSTSAQLKGNQIREKPLLRWAAGFRIPINHVLCMGAKHGSPKLHLLGFLCSSRLFFLDTKHWSSSSPAPEGENIRIKYKNKNKTQNKKLNMQYSLFQGAPMELGIATGLNQGEFFFPPSLCSTAGMCSDKTGLAFLRGIQ